uniref:GTPase SLIP-GC n=1 Tax=Callorhinchus milii TaxID=7868 RepID=V9KAL3_CALMI
MEVDNSDDDIIHTGVTRKRTTVTTTTTTKFSSDTPSKTKGCATTSKVSPQKKRKRQSAGAQMSEENKEVLQLCKDLEKETRDLINKVHMKLENVVCNDPEEKELVITLKEKASILKSKTLLDKIYIGVFGKTGDGKSSLINAVLHKHGLLPTSSCTACTSSIINVETYSGRRFKADIEFITEEEWNKELKDLMELCENGKDDDDSESNEIVENAEAKVKAVYGERGPEQSYQELLKYNIYKTIVPKNNKYSFSEDNAQNLSCKLKRYVCSKKSGEENHLWPLVKSVTIFIPKSNVLPEGLVLTDFPGTGDSNKARDEMWKEYLTRCSSVWIISVAHRADSDKIGDQIFSKTVNTACIGGKCQDVTFVCTKTDQLSTAEFIKEQNISPEEMNISPNDSPEVRETKERHFCVLKRNDIVKKNVLKRCKEKWNRRKHQITSECEFSRDDIHVFTVSCEEYWKVHNDHYKSIFIDSETGIPDLKDHIVDVYLKNRKKVVSVYVSEVCGMLHLLTSLKDSVANEFYKSTFKIIDLALQSQMKEFAHEIKNLATKLENSLSQGCKKAEKVCMKAIEKRVELPSNSNQGYHRTLKAICQKDGIHISRKFGEIDVNHEIAKPLYEVMESIFRNMFQMKRGTRNNIKGCLEIFQTSMTTVIKENLKNRSSTGNAESWEHREKFLIAQGNGFFIDMENYIIEKKKSIYRSPAKSVQHKMKPAYEEASQKKGSKLLKEMKRILTTHLETHKPTMFTYAVGKTMKEFNEMKAHVERKLETELRKALKLGLAQWPGHTILPDFTEELKDMIEKSNEIDSIRMGLECD